MALKEGTDFYYNENGLMVLTAGFLRRRGYCCQSGCRHCPYPQREACRYCHATAEPVFVHGHYQCGACGTNVEPCCG